MENAWGASTDVIGVTTELINAAPNCLEQATLVAEMYSGHPGSVSLVRMFRLARVDQHRADNVRVNLMITCR